MTLPSYELMHCQAFPGIISTSYKINSDPRRLREVEKGGREMETPEYQKIKWGGGRRSKMYPNTQIRRLRAANL